MDYITKKVYDTNKFENYGLSPREKDVAVLLLQGLTTRQISSSLGIKESTVSSYCKSLYKKLGINSRVEMFATFGFISSLN